jgi:hypothetical protein
MGNLCHPAVVLDVRCAFHEAPQSSRRARGGDPLSATDRLPPVAKRRIWDALATAMGEGPG